MSEIADNTLCEKFEANVFAKSRCQNCFRALGAHQRVNQAPEEHAVNTSGCGNGAINKSSSGDQWDPLCILVPQCELYVCVGSEERAESCQESLEYTQLSGTADKESEEESEDSSTGTSIDADTNATLDRDWEMTRLLDSILGSDKQSTMYYAGKKQEIRSENLHADRSRWSETTTSRSCGKTEPWSCLKPGHPEPKVVSQDHADKWRKPQAESGYFSLERRKSEPSCMSSPPPIGRSPLPVRGDASRTGGYPTSSISSADSNLSCHTSGRSEGQHGLMRQEYTVLADLPKPKRISHREAFEKERSSSRTRSPGRAEVERIFGHERRKSETLGAFQALEEGLLDRLDSKTLKLAKEGRLARRKSSPTLHREASKRLPWEPEQPKKSRGESLHMGRPQQRPERSSGSPSGSSRSGSPTQRLERENRSKGSSLHPAVPSQQVRGERRKREEPAHSPKGDRGRTPLHAATHGKKMDNSRKNGLETVHQHTSSGKTTDSKWKNCLGALHATTPTQSLDKSQTRQRGQLERYKESDRRARGKPLLPVDTAEQPKKDVRDCREAVHTLSPGRGTAAPGKDGPTRSPRRQVGGSWGGQEETKHSLRPGSSMATSLKSHRDVGGRATPERCMRGNQGEARHSLSSERSMGTGFKSHGELGRSVSPQRYTGDNQRETRRSLSPERSMGTSFRSYGEAGHSASPQRYTGGSQRETRHSLSPERSVGSSFKSHGEAGRSISPQRYTGDNQRETRRSISPERSMRTGFRSHREAGYGASPPRYTGQRETRHSLSPDRSMGMGFRSHGEAGHSLSPHRYTGGSQRESGHSFSPERHTGGSQRESGRSCSPERFRESRDISETVRHSPSPGRPVEINCSSPRQPRCRDVPQQHPDSNWKSQKEILARKPRISADSDWPGKGQQSTSWTSKKENDWDRCGKSLYPASPPVAEEMRTDQGEPSPPINPFWTPENNQGILEGPLCHMHPMQLMEKEQISSRVHLHSTKPGQQQQQLETDGKTQASSAEWMENKWANQERSQSPMRPERKVENDGSKEEKFLQQAQTDRGPPLKTACSSQSQDPNLNVNQKHQVQ